ncbi:energy-coupling factor transporter transmembrane protein EcfT [Methanosalsum natronophilum]|nr:energy-coupling factor transporter transmembrane protein EcfT [Methanosalsum natronophilum]
MQLLFTDGNEIISFINTSITYEGLYLGLTVISRFVFLILFATVLTSTTRPSMITNGIERILRPLPLKYLGISSHELATMMSLSIRFIPELFENAKEIKDAQVSRGMDPSRSFLKSISSISIPLVSNSLNYVEELVIAMENRCFQGQERTNLYELKMDKSDWISLLILCSLLISYLYFT